MQSYGHRLQKAEIPFHSLLVDGKELETVDSARILGVTISCNLKWNNQVNDVIKRANKRLYFLVLLKRARVPADDIINFYVMFNKRARVFYRV